MGWGCYKHEIDAGSFDWNNSAEKLCERKLKEEHLTFGRHGEVCPKCYIDLEERLAAAEELQDPAGWKEWHQLVARAVGAKYAERTVTLNAAKALQAENAKLRAALEECVDWMCEAHEGTDQWERGKAAREALGKGGS